MKAKFLASIEAPESYEIHGPIINGLDVSQFIEDQPFVETNETIAAGVFDVNSMEGVIQVTLAQNGGTYRIAGLPSNWEESDWIELDDYEPDRCYIKATSAPEGAYCIKEHGEWSVKLPDPPTYDHPDDLEMPELTPEELQQYRLEQLERWRQVTVVSAFQAHQALADFGYIEQVETMMASTDTADKTRRAWRMASEYRRFSPTVVEIGAELGLSEEEKDKLFRHALTIEA